MTRMKIGTGLVLAMTTACSFHMRAGAGSNVAANESPAKAAPDGPAKPERVPAKPRRRPHPSKPEPEVTKPPEPEVTRPPTTKPPRTRPVDQTQPQPDVPPAKPPTTTKPSEPKPPVVKPKPEPLEQGMAGFVKGVPQGLKAGAPDSFWIYQDDAGWHLRTTTSSRAWKTFKGRVWINDGALTIGKLFSTEDPDKANFAEKRIDFDFETSDGIDGIDFAFPKTRCVRFDLRYEGRSDPKVILVGAKKVNPPAAAFTICRDL